MLLNLVVNAFEAMRETAAEERRLIIRSERESDGRVRVSVRDFGTGLPAEEPEQIFQQFFSTANVDRSEQALKCQKRPLQEESYRYLTFVIKTCLRNKFKHEQERDIRHVS